MQSLSVNSDKLGSHKEIRRHAIAHLWPSPHALQALPLTSPPLRHSATLRPAAHVRPPVVGRCAPTNHLPTRQSPGPPLIHTIVSLGIARAAQASCQSYCVLPSSPLIRHRSPFLHIDLLRNHQSVHAIRKPHNIPTGCRNGSRVNAKLFEGVLDSFLEGLREVVGREAGGV